MWDFFPKWVEPPNPPAQYGNFRLSFSFSPCFDKNYHVFQKTTLCFVRTDYRIMFKWYFKILIKKKNNNSWCLNLKSSCLGWFGSYSENSMLLYAHYAVRTGLNWKYSDEILIALVLKEPLSWSPQKNSGYNSEILLSSQSSIAIHYELERCFLF